MIRAHRDAVTASLEADLPGAVFKSYEAAKKAPTVAAYAVVFIALSRRDRTRFTGPQSRATFTATVHCVGESEDSALWVQERVDKLTDKVLTVAGRSLRPVEYVTGVAPDLDDGTDPLWFTISQFDIVSDPA
ncbi:hypothetical protein K0U83_10355 [bacterium]|nr:hypothetical protein [bacterium]